jgi:hypothetical protein
MKLKNSIDERTQRCALAQNNKEEKNNQNKNHWDHPPKFIFGKKTE